MQHRPFYPGDCEAQLRTFLASQADVDLPTSELVAAVAPHAGWRFSGGIAARTIARLARSSCPDCVVLLGAYHRPVGQGSALYQGDEWETPFGNVPLAQDLVTEVEAKLPDLVETNSKAHDTEHSLEVILPFVKALFPQAGILPLLILPEASPVRLGERLAEITQDRSVVAVASTDLTHYGAPYDFTPAGAGPEAHRWMRANDKRLLQLACELEAEKIPAETVAQRNACGPGALAAVCAFARARGVATGTLLEHTDSHEVTTPEAPFQLAVGYAGLVF